MRIAGSLKVLSQSEIGMIHRAMLRILSEVGMLIENDTILSKLTERGAHVEAGTKVVRFSPNLVESFISESRKFDWENVEPSVSANAGIFLGRYLDPETDEFVPWTEERIARYARVAQHLENVTGASMLGCPVEGVPRKIHPLYQRYLCWKYGMRAGGSIWDIGLCPYILEMCDVMADATGKKREDFFTGYVFLSTTLKFPANEAEQYVYFAERGLPVSINHMTSAGGTAPVTLAGAVALHLAETVVINIIQRAFYGKESFDLSCTISPLDMRTLIYPYGRPERQIVNLMMADMAKHYGATFRGHCGQTDAKRPSAEAGAQKALTTIPTLLSCGRTQVAAGLLSVDEVFSPIQMIIDDEFTAALKRLVRGCDVSEETLAVDVIKAVGCGGLFIDTEHTAKHFRSEFWEPRIWSREMFDSWVGAGAKTDVDRAREIYGDIMSQPEPEPRISEDTERRLKKIMDDAVRKLM